MSMHCTEVVRVGNTVTETPGTAKQPRRHGSQIVDGGVVFNLWAPSAQSVELLEVGQAPRLMLPDADGW